MLDTPTKPATTYEEYWEANYANANVTGADRTFGETVWNDAQTALLESLLELKEEE